MKRREFKIIIDTSREKVWQVLWADATYPEWTAPFCEGSRAETDWQEGSRVLFLSPDGSGMLSKIAVSRPYEFMSFEHQGMVNNGVEDTKSDMAKEWAGAKEDYTLKTVDGKTELVLEMDIGEEYLDEFLKTWPKALEKVKELAEGV